MAFGSLATSSLQLSDSRRHDEAAMTVKEQLASSAKQHTAPMPQRGCETRQPSSQIPYGLALYQDLQYYSDTVILQEGRHSTVTSAFHQHMAQPCVIKAYLKSSLKPRQLANVYREVRLLGSLKDRVQGIVSMLAAFEDDLKIYLVFEACMRGDLYQLLIKEPNRCLTEELVASAIALPLIVTVAELHSLEIVHRDIKPENVFIDLEGRVRLGDFGLAAQHSDTLTERVGTLDYMAPEVIAMPTPGEIESGRNVPPQPYNEKVDIWAIGCLCYELLTGRPPFEVEDPKQTAKLITSGKPASFPTHISQSACDFIRATLALKHSQRPSAKQLLQHPWLKPHMQAAPQTVQPQAAAHHGAHHAAHQPAPAISAAPTMSADPQAPLPAQSPQGVLTQQLSERPSASPGDNEFEFEKSDLYAALATNSLCLLRVHETQLQQRYQQQLECTTSASHTASPPHTPAQESEQGVSYNGSYDTSSSPPLSAKGSLGERSAQDGSCEVAAVLPPGPQLSEQFSAGSDNGLGIGGANRTCGGGGGGGSGVHQGKEAGGGAGLRSLNNRRASSGTSEYLTYQTPRCGSPEPMPRASSSSLITFSSHSHSHHGGFTLATPSDAAAVSLANRCASSCTGALEETQSAGSAAGELKDSSLSLPLAWQASPPSFTSKKSHTVGKSRFAR